MNKKEKINKKRQFICIKNCPKIYKINWNKIE